MTSVKEHAYAKINLYLDVIAKREDGFHEIKTVMHTVSLCDEIVVSILPSDKRNIKLTVSGNYKLPTDSRNLTYRAAELFLDRMLTDGEVHIHLNKSIPVAAGLAGGSADAAAVLRALNKLYKRPFTEKCLLGMAAELGSDVPFCLIGGTALCTGRGEEMKRLDNKLSLYTVIAVADEHISTPQAYAGLDEMYDDFSTGEIGEGNEHYGALMSSLGDGVLTKMKLYNIFENSVLPICSGAETIKNKLLQLGATHALMSGSGPSVFGIFTDKASAESAAAVLVEDGFRAYFAQSV